MDTKEKTVITVEAIVDAPLQAVWNYWTNPQDIVEWNSASEDWHTTRAENDLRKGGKFMSRMEAKDGSSGFNFEGVYQNVIPEKLIEYTIVGGRKVKIIFIADNDKTKIIESFDAEDINSVKIQRNGWQSILNNFKKYSELK